MGQDAGIAMDRRIVRTRQSIIRAFFELRSQRGIERITIRELCERANINKSTFYTHYKDIYDLTEQLETRITEDILSETGNVELLFTEPEEAVRRLYYAYLSHDEQIKILFSGSRSNMLVARVEERLRERFNARYPGLMDNATVRTMLTFEIYGQYHTYYRCRQLGDEVVIGILSAHWRETVRYLRDKGYLQINL